MSIQDYFDQSCDDEIEIDEPLHLQPTATYPIGVTLNPTGVQQALDDYHRLLAALENLRRIPHWATIQLGTTTPCCPYTVFIREGDVGGELILSTDGTDLIATLEAAYQQYLLFNREYALKVKGHDDE